MATIIVNATHGPEDPERATLAFVAATSPRPPTRTRSCFSRSMAPGSACGGAPTASRPGCRPCRDVMAQFVGAGGRIWACGACTKPAGITRGRPRRGRNDRDGRPGRGASCIGRCFAYLLSLMRTIERRTSGARSRSHRASRAHRCAAAARRPRARRRRRRDRQDRPRRADARRASADRPARRGPRVRHARRSGRSSRRSAPIPSGRR